MILLNHLQSPVFVSPLSPPSTEEQYPYADSMPAVLESVSLGPREK